MFELPGGYQPRTGAPIARSVTPGELNGTKELAISEALESPSRSEAVSRVLSQLIARIGGMRANAEMMSGLSVADRTYALMRLGQTFGYSHFWRSAICLCCEEHFDVSIDLSAVEIGARPETFPEMRLETSTGPLVVRAPTGADQAAISDADSAEKACRQLLERCLHEASGGAVDLEALSNDDIESIAAVFDKLALGIPLSATAHCPQCEVEVSVPFEPLEWVTRLAGDLLDQVHEIASAYHWPEKEILDLPRNRRLNYLRRLGAPVEVGPQ